MSENEPINPWEGIDLSGLPPIRDQGLTCASVGHGAYVRHYWGE